MDKQIVQHSLSIVDFGKSHRYDSPKSLKQILRKIDDLTEFICIPKNVTNNNEIIQCKLFYMNQWSFLYKPFAEKNIPEIMDLNILPYFRNHGIATKLLEIAEKEARSKSNIIGIGVGLYGGPDGGYGAAQRLYVKRGYIPDGYGVTYDYRHATPGERYPLDDDLILWFTKILK